LATDYMERVLPAREQLRARWHLFLCSACRRYFDQLRRTVGLMADGATRQAPTLEQEARLLDGIAAARMKPGSDGPNENSGA
jgi:predicted anti-sigma-YlaC factor YlaD